MSESAGKAFADDLGAALAQEGMDRALAHADPRWHGMARWVLEQFIAKGEVFSTDDLWAFLEELDVRTRENRAMGGIIRESARRGEIRRVGWVTTARPVAHSRPVAQWIRA